ncbi:hypothetical protein FHR70_001863 [Microvirga lupini]|uniref:Uncharacterized protein n=1 Tax=Microvirga lupini TaxID=420324 RepID=A0A7W4VKC9_9HYPH|nr:hypothetical protein [Microvirga lupini]
MCAMSHSGSYRSFRSRSTVLLGVGIIGTGQVTTWESVIPGRSVSGGGGKPLARSRPWIPFPA